MKELTENEALQKAAAFCSGAEHCRSEIVRKLALWGLPAPSIEKITAYLQKEKYIDEERYCRAFVHDKVLYNKWGRTKIRMALRQKQISETAIKLALSDLPADDYLTGLQNILKAKSKTIKAANEYEKRNKLIRFALSRGFEMDAVCQCLQTDYNEIL